jgi:hypothetical protein
MEGGEDMTYRPYDVVGYSFRADTYCPECTVLEVLKLRGIEGHGLSYYVEEALNLLARFEGIDREDELTFDSGDFPKVIFRDQVEDPCQVTCARCGILLADVSSLPAVWNSTAGALT